MATSRAFAGKVESGFPSANAEKQKPGVALWFNRTARRSRSTFQPGDVVVEPFPYLDRFAEKRRLALVASSGEVQALGFIWLVMITSAKQSKMKHDHRIRDLDLAGLEAASVVRPVKIACIEPSRVLRRLGALAPKEAGNVLETVGSFIGSPFSSRA